MTRNGLAPDSGIGHSLHGTYHTDVGPSSRDDEQDRDSDVLAMLDGFDDADDEFAFWFVWLND